MADVLGGNSDSAWRQAWSLFAGSRLLAVSQAVLAFAGGLLEALILTLFARIALAGAGVGGTNVTVPLAGDLDTSVAITALVLLILLRFLLGVASAWTNGALAFRIVVGIREEMLRDYVGAEYLVKDDLDDGGLQQLIVTFPSQGNGLIQGLTQSGAALLTMSAMLAFSFGSDAFATLALLGAIVAVSALLVPLRRVVRKFSSEAVETQVRLSSAVAELAELRAEVEAFGVGPSAVARVGGRIQSDGHVGRRMAIIKQLIPPAYHGVTYLAVALGLLLLSQSSPEDLTTIGPIMLVILRTLAYGQAVQQGAVLIAQIGPFLGYLNATVERFRQHAVRVDGEPVRQFRQIQFRSVSFRYPSSAGGRGVRDLDLTIQHGQSVGLVGPSGGGKSTTLKLLAGLYAPSGGTIEIDGRPLQSLSRAGWSSLVGFVPQHPRLLNASIAENVRFFRDGISEDEVRRALSAADLLVEIDALERGIDTVIGPGATTLSGGQMQRLAIARALVGRPALIVMDEPTSAIDQESEREVAAAVAAVAAEVTVVIASHRPQILEHCDRVIEVGPSGVVVERTQPDPKVER